MTQPQAGQKAAGPVIACTTHSFGIIPLAAAFRVIRALEIGYVDLIAATYPQQLEPSAEAPCVGR